MNGKPVSDFFEAINFGQSKAGKPAIGRCVNVGLVNLTLPICLCHGVRWPSGPDFAYTFDLSRRPVSDRGFVGLEEILGSMKVRDGT
jgi:hypothetical protein